MEHPDQMQIEVFAKDSISIAANVYKTSAVPEIRRRLGIERGRVEVSDRISRVYGVVGTVGASGYGRGAGLLRTVEKAHRVR